LQSRNISGSVPDLAILSSSGNLWEWFNLANPLHDSISFVTMSCPILVIYIIIAPSVAYELRDSAKLMLKGTGYNET
jgi:hypothetical protein